LAARGNRNFVLRYSIAISSLNVTNVSIGQHNVYVAASDFSLNYLYLRNTKKYNHLRYIAFKIVQFGNYTFLPATAKVLETFLEAIL